ncbi:hypothetical protein NKH56_28855 [Mesorhizobium sp. M1076]|uniref:hypothetical protein n=1 Tax=Mesorhizobium sp. M1076 TaxID=2957054 RepID=UPI0033350BB7
MAGTLTLILADVASGNDSLSVTAVGYKPASGTDGVFTISSIVIVVRIHGVNPIDTTLFIDEKQSLEVDIPSKLLIEDGKGNFRIRSRDELDDLALEEWAALKDKVRRRLAEPIIVLSDARANPQKTLFGVATVGGMALVDGRVWLNAALVDGLDSIGVNGWLLRAQAAAEIKLSYTQKANTLDLGGRLALLFEVRKAALDDWIDLHLDFDLPTLPGFDLKLPKIKLPKLAFPAYTTFDDALPTLFTVALPPFFEKFNFTWDDPKPQLAVTLKQGDIVVATSQPGNGTLKYDGTDFCKLQQVMLQYADPKFDFSATIVPTVTPITIAPGSFRVPPFQIDISEPLTATLAFKDLDLGDGKPHENLVLETTLQCNKLVLSAIDDPSTCIALSFEVVITYSSGSGKTSTTLKKLAIVEPYPIALIVAAAEQLGELIRLVGAIPLPSAKTPNVDMSSVMEVIKRLAKMLASAAKWLARQAGEAIGLLAGLVEAVLEAVLQLLKELVRLGSDVGNEIISHIAVEVRLDPKTYRLRQIIIMPVRDDSKPAQDVTTSALGFDFAMAADLRPALVIDLGPESWTGIVVQPAGSFVSLATDFWLAKETGPQQAITTIDKDGVQGQSPPRLVQLKATPMTVKDDAAEIVIAAVQRGQLRLFQTFAGDKPDTKNIDLGLVNRVAVAIRETGLLRDGELQLGDDVNPNAIFKLQLNYDGLKARLLSLFAKADAGGAGGFIDRLKQRIEITDVKSTFGSDKTSAQVALTLAIHIDEEFVPATDLVVSASLRDLSMKVTGGDRIIIKGPDKEYHPLGLTLNITEKVPNQKKETYPQFVLDLSHGNESLGLADEAKADLSFGQVSTSGKGLQFEVPTLRIGRGGIDLEAKVLPEPVKLGGVDVPFRFTSGQVSIKSSKFGGGSLAGAGQLPSALVGEANANIALQLGANSDGGVIVKSATARLDKSGDPIRCSSTRFELTITELGFDYRYEGSYHFFFLLTGSAVFKPNGNEYSSGLLKNLRDVTIKLDKAPLSSDPRVLLRSISFQVKVDPPKRISLFDIFSFDLKGFGFHPASPKFDGDPAMNISGQVHFLKTGNRISADIEFHGLWFTGPKTGSSKPRIRFDGLSVGIRTGGVDIEGTALAVDGSLPDLYKPGTLPADIKADGFLANGKVDIDGWASMTAAMGFLELRKDGYPDPKHSFFLYGQLNKLAVPIRTPVGTIYLREAGFGFGYRYTIAGINRAEKATSPRQLVKILDDVSKYQGNLYQFQAWEPTYDNSDLTLALRGMFALSAVEGDSYDEKGEKDLPNPLLFDIVAAFRTDFTFLINIRAWVSVNYNDWASSGLNEPWKSNPTMRGYLYFSVPRKEFLGRFLSDGKGYVGNHPELPKALADAISATRFSATLYIRPGLFHAELGWPYELGFSLGEPDGKFYLSLSGGLIHRIEDASLLNGIAFRANGSVYLEGRVGGSSLGAAAVARANFAIEAKVLSYLSLKNFGESFYYGYLRIDVAVLVSVEVWISFKIFGKRIRLSVGFSLHLAVSIALEAVIGAKGIGGRAHVSIGVCAFGRTLSVGIGFSFNNDKLADARAKVARFMELGLATEIPDKAKDGQRIETNPKPEPSRKEVAQTGDTIVEEDIGSEPLPREPDEDTKIYRGREIGQTDFWAVLFPTARPSGAKDDDEGPWYLMQLLPRDHTSVDGNPIRTLKYDELAATFFAGTATRALGSAGHQIKIEVDKFKEAKHLEIGHIRPKSEAEWYEIAPGKSVSIESCTNLGAVVAEEGGEKLQLGPLLDTLFLGEIVDDKLDSEEPSARVIEPELSKLADSAKTSAQQLGRIGRGRTNLTGRLKREAEIEEARSAIVSAVAETAATIAAQGETDRIWPERRDKDIDARDFDLTFVLSASGIVELFDGDAEIAPPLGRFTVLKSDTVNSTKRGIVHLFNHPSRMFRQRQPKLSPTHVFEEQGVKLNWDLEPDWGQSVGAYHDPEFHLKHYRIRRVVVGVPGSDFCAKFVAKRGSAIEYLAAAGMEPERARLVQKEFQFIDDLRSQIDEAGRPGKAIPEAMRRLLLGQGTAKDAGEMNVNISNLKLTYQIVPIDNAGTSDKGKLYEIRHYDLRDVPPRSPREAALQIAYDRMPTPFEKGVDAATAALLVMLKPAVRVESDIETVEWPLPRGKETLEDQETDPRHVYLLRVQKLKVAPSGGYGADAIDDSRRRPDQAAIDGMDADEVADFLLEVVDELTDFAPEVSGKKPVLNIVAEHQLNEHQLNNKEEFETRRYTAAVHEVPKGAGEIVVGDGSKIDTLLWSLGVSVQNPAKAEAGAGYRVFLARLYRDKAQAKQAETLDLRRRGEWKTLALNIVIGVGEGPPALSSVVEVLERPVQLQFAALKRQDMRVESGRVDIVQPSAGSKLGDLTGRNSPFKVVRDARRRTAMRLEWNARPQSLELTGSKASPADLHRWISGFQVFSVDPETLTDRDDDGLVDDVEEMAQQLGRVSLLPATMLGLDPAGFGDFRRIEAAYPSDTLRLECTATGQEPGGARKAGWYSAAETAAIFPQPSIRRSLMPDPDEGLISSLFAGGTPDAIRVSIPEWHALDDQNAKDRVLIGWSIEEKGSRCGSWGEYEKKLPRIQFPRRAKDARFEVTFALAEIAGQAAPKLRRLLQNLRLAPNGSDDGGTERAALERRVAEPDYLAKVVLRLEAIRFVGKSKEPRIVATHETGIDLIPRLHPIIADTLAFIQYDSWAAGGLKESNGRIFRRYAISRDADPEITTTEFDAYIDQAPVERDPFGWGALRTMGLAAGFRLYDTEAKDYVRFGKRGDLAQRIEAAFARALERYDDGLRDNGQPFVDILTQPWGNARLSWFDGGQRNPTAEKEIGEIESAMLAATQIALRPHPDRRAANLAVPQMVRYYALTAQTGNRKRPQWTISKKEGSDAVARYDILSVAGGIVAQKPARLDKDTPQITLFEPWPAIETKSSKRFIIAVVREVLIKELLIGDPNQNPKARLDIQPPDDRNWGFEAIEQPSAMLSLEQQKAATEHAFGRFEALPAEDWSDALFRPVAQSTAINPHEGLQRLAYYVGRRFDPLQLPTAAGQSEDQQRDAAAERKELADRIVRFWTRFVEHCAPGWGRPSAQPDDSRQARQAIFFSLGTIADPGLSRCAPSSTGTLSMTVVDVEQRGARRKLTVRPYGRYDDWAAAVETKVSKLDISERGLRGAFENRGGNDLGTTYFVDTTLPRTEPLEKPVILSTAVHKPAGKGQPGRFELVVAHGSDIVLAQANRRNAALLAPLDLSVGFWREFGHTLWLDAIRCQQGDRGYDALAPFGSLDQRLDLKKIPIDRAVAEQRLVDLRRRVPDAWVGSTMITATQLPYFFRTHALVHAAAGIVVSEQASVTFEEGFYELAWPFLPGDSGGREIAKEKHQYSVERRFVAAIPNPFDPKGPPLLPEFEIPVITFDIAALRFIDCMDADEAGLWFGSHGENCPDSLKRVTHLPEPGVSYRISMETVLRIISDKSGSRNETLARVQEIDVLASQPKQKTDPLYLLQGSGSRFQLDESHAIKTRDGTFYATNPRPPKAPAGYEWRVPVAVLVTQQPSAMIRAVTADQGAILKKVTSNLPPPKGWLPPAIGALAAVSVSWTMKPRADQWDLLLARLRKIGDSPEAIQLVEAAKGGQGIVDNSGLGLQLGLDSATNNDIKAALLDLGSAMIADISAIIIRRPPTDDELRKFDPADYGGASPAVELKLLVLEMAETQLFGPGRRPAVSASKGPEVPITHPFARRIGG